MKPESSTKWAIGTGIGVLALVLGLVQWLFPHGPKDDSGAPSAAASATSPAPKSDLPRTPMIGYEFWQDDKPALMKRGPETPEYVTHVTLKRSPFEIRLPKPPQNTAVFIGTWTDASIFNLQQGAPYANHPVFGEGRGMANGNYFDGNLYPSNEGFTLLYGPRLVSLNEQQDQIVVSAFGETQIAGENDPIYLAIFIDNNGNARFDITEYDYVVLTFA